MKRFLWVLLFCLLLPFSGQADSLYDWNISCPWKMRKAETVYSDGDVKRVRGTIPAGTYVKVRVLGEEYVFIDYKTAGSSGVGWVKRTSVMSAKITFTTDDGGRNGIHELLYNGEGTPDEVQGYSPVSMGYKPGWKYVQNPDGTISPLPGTETSSPGNTGGSTSSGSTGGSASSGSSSGSSKKAQAETVKISLASAPDAQVDMVRAGTAKCLVKVNGAQQWVPAGDVMFSSSAPEDRRFAVIHAPKTGKATLRQKASASSQMLKNCKAGQVALVLEEGKTFTQVFFKDTVGYILTDALRFTGAAEEMTEGKLAYNGRTNGSTTINMRLTEKGLVIADFPTGTPVTVIAPGDEWTEIETEGYRGFVMNKFLVTE